MCALWRTRGCADFCNRPRVARRIGHRYTERDSSSWTPLQPRLGEGGSSSAVVGPQLGPPGPRQSRGKALYFPLWPLVPTMWPQRFLPRCSPRIVVFAVILCAISPGSLSVTNVCRPCGQWPAGCARSAANVWKVPTDGLLRMAMPSAACAGGWSHRS